VQWMNVTSSIESKTFASPVLRDDFASKYANHQFKTIC